MNKEIDVFKSGAKATAMCRIIYAKSRKFLARVGCGVIIVGLTACASVPSPNLLSSVESDIEFIDLDLFDISLTENMRQQSGLVTVTFPNQPTTVNQIPDRLQRWLSAVHVHGGGVKVETKEGYVQKDIGTVVALMVSAYKLAVKAVPVVLSKNYKAVIVTDSGVVERIDFQRL